MADIRVPALGESVTEATIGKWFKRPGDRQSGAGCARAAQSKDRDQRGRGAAAAEAAAAAIAYASCGGAESNGW